MIIITSGSNLLNCCKEESIQGIVQGSGSVHLINSILEHGHNYLKHSHVLYIVVEQMVLLAIAICNKSALGLFMNYKVKKFAKTRYSKRLDAYREFFFNRETIYAYMTQETKYSGHKVWVTYKANMKKCEILLNKLIMVMEVEPSYNICLCFNI